MVKVGFRTAFLLAALLPILQLSARDLGDYQLGDRAEEEIVATAKLSFVDVEATQSERDKEAQRVPVVVRYYTNAADDLEARFRQAFVKTHEGFLQSLNRSFGHRTLSAEEIDSFKFQSLALLFQKQNDSFPLSTNRAAAWARGDDDKAFQDSLAAALRQVMAPVIRPEPVAANFRLGAMVRLVPVARTNDAISESMVANAGRDFVRTNFVSLNTVRKNLLNDLLREDRDAAGFLAAQIEPNCTVDEALTQQLRAARTENIWSVCTIEPGQVVARRGQVIDKKVKEALDQLREKTVVRQLQQLEVKQQVAVGELRQMVTENKTKDARAQEQLLWLVGGLAAVVFILAAATWQLARRRQHATSLVPATVGATDDWQQRALAAERSNERLRHAARTGLIDHLSQWFSRLLTQRLISQRQLLLETHDNAATEMAALEERLEKVQAPLQVRLAAYEHRIAELEKDLAARGEENRELLKAKIETMRKQLEAERGKNRVTFN